MLISLSRVGDPRSRREGEGDKSLAGGKAGCFFRRGSFAELQEATGRSIEFISTPSLSRLINSTAKFLHPRPTSREIGLVSHMRLRQQLLIALSFTLVALPRVLLREATSRRAAANEIPGEWNFAHGGKPDGRDRSPSRAHEIYGRDRPEDVLTKARPARGLFSTPADLIKLVKASYHSGTTATIRPYSLRKGVNEEKRSENSAVSHRVSL